MSLSKSMKNSGRKERLPSWQEYPCVQQSGTFEKKRMRVFQHKARQKVMMFRSIYEDIRELLKTCHWKSSGDNQSLSIFSNLDVDPDLQLTAYIRTSF